MNEPDFILIGETKCGTTSLYNYLIQHSQVLETLGNGEGYDESYRTKELRFFDKFFYRGIEWYKSCFPKTLEGQITGEATPMYFYRVQSAQRIKNFFPDIKLILVLRNPVDRFVSQFYHNHKWVPGFSERYTTIRDFLNSSLDSDHYILQKGMYYYTLINWLNYFSLDQFHIFSSEDLFRYPRKVLLELTDFLEIGDESLSDYQIFRSNTYFPLDNETRIELNEYYKFSNEKLFKLIGKRFDWK